MTEVTGTLAPAIPPVFWTETGALAVGYQLFVYDAGTSTKATTYTNAALSATNTNPIIIDASGRATIFLAQAHAYDFKFCLPTEPDPPLSPLWTRLGVFSVPYSAASVDVTGTAGETITAKKAVYLSDGSGGKTAGKWYLASSDNPYSSSLAGAIGISQAAIGSGSTGQIRVSGLVEDMSSLSPGTTYNVTSTAGSIGATAVANFAPVGIAMSSTALLMSQWTVQDYINTYGDNGENLVKDGSFDIWAASTSPTHWTASGGTLSKVAGSLGANGCQIVAGATNRQLTQTILASGSMPTWGKSQAFSVSVWASSTGTGTWQAYWDDGVNTGSSTNLNVGTAIERISMTIITNASASQLKFGLNCVSGSTVTVHGVRVVRGTIPPITYKPSVALRREKDWTISGGQSTGTFKGGVRWNMPWPGKVLETRLTLGTACAGAAFIVDVNKNNVSMYSTRPTIADGSTTGSAVPDAAAYDTYCFTRGDLLSFDIDQVGSGTAGSDLTVTVVYRCYPNPFDESEAVGTIA